MIWTKLLRVLIAVRLGLFNFCPLSGFSRAKHRVCDVVSAKGISESW